MTNQIISVFGQAKANHPYLFANKSTIMSLVQSAKLNWLNPLEYLKDVMDRMPTQPYSKIADLLPFNWKPAQSARRVCWGLTINPKI